jgi:ABC-type transport system involved in cytochrome bd biosynthesis fused ATPase/permease subunit
MDPAVQIWNRSFLDNLCYGNENDTSLPFAQIIEQTDLRQVLESLPDGLQTSLGEGGGLISGGEGQRVRLGRGMLRPGVRLVILDEPFRGLGRSQRRELLARARRLWSGATLLCITHDVSETQAFERVLVMEGGRSSKRAARPRWPNNRIPATGPCWKPKRRSRPNYGAAAPGASCGWRKAG